jgi:hypothetical protein
MRTLGNTIRIGLSLFWRGLRQWSGDAAYERYLECAVKNGSKVPLPEADFYLEQLNRKYTRPNRCC